MKKSLVLLLLSSLVSGLYARQPRTVVEPPFAFRNSGTLEIERIELAPESTTVYIQAYFRPHNWIRISSETYIRTGAEGEKLTVRSADGMPLDTEFYMPETGRHDFSLSFPPVDPKTAKIDLIESDCPDCFKIYDIDLTGKKAKPGRSALAKKYKKAAPLTENFTAPVVSDSPARIAGAITGYDPRFFDRIEIAFYSPIVGDGATELSVPVREDGSFETGLNILTPIRGMLFLPGFVTLPFYAEPGRETALEIDLGAIYRKTSVFKELHPQTSPVAYYGELGRVNEELARLQKIQIRTGTLHIGYHFDRLTRIHGMRPEQYKQYVTEESARRLAQIDTLKEFCPRSREIAEKTVRAETLTDLLNYSTMMEHAYRTVNKLWDRSQPLDIEIEKPDPAYYDFVNDYPANDETMLAAGTTALDALNDFTLYLIATHPQTQHPGPQNRSFHPDSILNDPATVRLIGSDRGILYDLKRFRDMIGRINNGFPLTDAQAQSLDTLFSNRAFAREVLARQRRIDSLIAENKKKTGFAIRPTPFRDTPEQTIEAIWEAYRGKVVFVDVWETWCGPCRRAMEATEPIKKELDGRGIVYLYLASESSPLEAWHNMIPGIPGEHYRLDQETAAALREKFGFNGVPSYLLIDKEGKVAYQRTGFEGPEKIRQLLLEASEK